MLILSTRGRLEDTMAGGRVLDPLKTFGTVFVLLFSCVGAAHGDEPVTVSLDLHVSTTTYSGCPPELPSSFDCSSIATSIPSAPPALQVSLLAGGVVPFERAGEFGGLGGLQFSIEYPSSAGVVAWTLCTGGAEVFGGGWPGSGVGNAVTWPGGCDPGAGNTAGIERVGFWTLSPESTGILAIDGDPRVNHGAWFYDCNAEGYFICEALLGTANLTPGGPPGAVVCGGSCAIVGTPGNGTTVSASWGQVKSLYE
jgi:hypothetical protein